jgi:ABC-type multidrug transport system fused ATPase/permease subunit
VEASESGHLRVEQLSYRYPQGGHRAALDGLSFQVSPGGSLGLVGEVGSGKSTLLRLWLRLYTPPRGGLWMDGHDVLDWNLTQLRQRVAWVEQESFLFSLTIAENLKLQQQHLSHEDIVAAARLAELHDEVMSFPQGYDTLLGERGITLSGGQKQRLCLARALLKPAPFLVLDDTLSAVDADTERRILEGLKSRRSQQTLLVISHRISAVQALDEILVLEEGRVVQRGRHDELLQEQGLYRQLYELQSKEGR